MNRDVTFASLARSEDEPRIALAQVVRLRWLAFAGQLASLGVAAVILDLGLPWTPLLLLVGATLVTNLLAFAWLRLSRPVSPAHVGQLLALDVLLLTGLLHQSGGSSNPFGVLYLVHVTLAAVALRPAWSVFLAILSLACYALLFFSYVPVEALAHAHHGDEDAFRLHLQGMWVAFAVAALLIGHFTSQLRTALRRREEELARTLERSARYETLAAVGTLATGAAHELGTPLGTIAVAAREMERALTDEALRDDARLIREQVDRCRQILQRMRDEAGATGGEALAPAPLAAIVARAAEELPPERRRRLRVEIPEDLAAWPLPAGLVGRTLRDLLSNAFDASDDEAPVELLARSAGERIELAVVDRGTGMDAAVLARAVEPFFTTKEPGRGMGLGLHLAHGTAERLGGELLLESSPGSGTRATLVLPRRVA